MATGKTFVDFGPFPGAAYTTASVSGVSGLTAASLIEAWVFPSGTVDHTSDEHLVDPPRVIAADISGTSFTIHAFAYDMIYTNNMAQDYSSSIAPMHWGKWTIAWASL